MQIRNQRKLMKSLLMTSALLTVFLLTFVGNAFGQSETISINSDPFGGVADTDGIYTVSTSNYGNVTFKATDSGTGTAFGSLTPYAPGGSNGLLFGSNYAFPASSTSPGLTITDGGNAVNGIWFVFATDNGGEFSLDEIDVAEQSGLFTDIEVKGFRDGSEVASTNISIAPDSSLTSFSLSTAFSNVDEVRMRQKTIGLFDSGAPGFEGITINNIDISGAPNIEPTLTATGQNPTFTEGGSAQDLFSSVTASTVESGQTISALTFTVTNVSNGINEVINLDGTAIFLTHGTSGSTAGNSLTYSVTLGGSTATIALTGGTMSEAATQTLIDGMTYQNNSQNPTTAGNRVVTITSLQDSGGTANGGDDTASLSITSTVTVVGVNDEPTLTASATNPTFTEGGSAASLYTGTDVNTIESGQNITGLSFTITNVTNGSNERINVDGTTIVLTHGTNGSTAGNSLNYSVMVIGTTATVTMTGGNLSVAAAETMVDNMSYQNNSNSPNTSNRVVTLVSIQDSGGTSNGGDNTGSLAVASTVTVTQNNDEPTMTSNGSNPTFTEGGAAGSLYNGTSVSTVEAGQTIRGFTFTVTNVANGINEVINIDGTAIVLTHGTSGSTAGNSLTYSVTVVGGTATVALTNGMMSTATTQTLVDNMSYQNNSNTPNTSNRVVTITSLQDSGGIANGGDDTASLSIASTVTVVGVNDEPTLTASASNPTFTEGGSAASLYTTTDINTVESGQNITGLSFTITNVTNGSNERVNIDGTTIVLTHGTNGSTAGNSLNYSVMVIGTTATVTMTGGNLSVAAAETMVDSMSYQNNSNSPSTSNRVVTLTSIQDSGGTANGGDNTGSLAVASTVTVVQNNDEPTMTSNGSNPTFTEGGAAASLYSGTSVSTVEAGQTIPSFTFTVTNVTGGSNEVINLDGTAIVLTNGTSGTTAGNSLSYSVAVSSNTATVTLSAGTMSTATTQTLVDNMSYQHNGDDLGAGTRVVTLTSLQDSGGTANSGDDTASLSIASTVTMTDVNDEPTLTATGSNPTFTEGQAAAGLYTGASASTIEAVQTIAAMSFTVTNVTDAANERINFDGTSIVLTHGTSGSTAGNSITYTVSVAGSTATVSLSGGTVSTTSLQTIINAMSYQNNSDTPSTSNRVVTLTSIQDSGGTANSGDDTATLSIVSTVSVQETNDPPTFSATASNPTYIEGSAPVLLYSAASMSTVEGGQNIAGIIFTVTNVTDAIQEIINLDGTAIILTNGTSGTTSDNSFNFTVAVSGSTATVTLSGANVTTAIAQTIINGMSYQNNSDAPTTGNRVLTITGIQDTGGTAHGGIDTSTSSVVTTVSLQGVNDEPTLTATGSNPAFTEGSSAVSLYSGASASTIESGQTFISMLITVSNVNDGASERLSLDGSTIQLSSGSNGTTAGNGLTYTVNPTAAEGSNLTLTFSGNVSATTLQSIVNGMQYQNTASPITAGARNIRILNVQDSGGTANGGDDTASGLSIISTVTVSMIPTPTPTPTATPSPSPTATPNPSPTPEVPETSVGGVILDENGQPVVDAVVYIAGVGTTRTNNEGAFTFENVPTNTVFTITVQKAGVVFLINNFSTGAGQFVEIQGVNDTNFNSFNCPTVLTSRRIDRAGQLAGKLKNQAIQDLERRQASTSRKNTSVEAQGSPTKRISRVTRQLNNYLERSQRLPEVVLDCSDVEECAKEGLRKKKRRVIKQLKVLRHEALRANILLLRDTKRSNRRYESVRERIQRIFRRGRTSVRKIPKRTFTCGD